MQFDTISSQHWENIHRQLLAPSPVDVLQNNWTPTWDFGRLPRDLNVTDWLPEKFANRQFPARPLPATIPSILLENSWDELVSSLLKTGALNKCWAPELATVKSWLRDGTPVYLQAPGTTPTKVPHHVTEEQIAMAFDSLARFQVQGHTAGPFRPEELPWGRQELKYISLFGKQRPHSGSLRLINDHSSPSTGNFNSGISKEITDGIHLHMGTISDVVESLLFAGPGSFISKHDLRHVLKKLNKFSKLLYNNNSSLFSARRSKPYRYTGPSTHTRLLISAAASSFALS